MSTVICYSHSEYSSEKYIFDVDNGLGRRFDGIGAISGGGATSKLLINYPEKQRAQILDYLFKPNFGASLQILKVEIGGDVQSSEGTESSHMHYSWEENYQRGYEWWLMTEAKKRNPSIKLYGLPWGYPGWLGSGHWWPFEHANATSLYITKWIKAARTFYNLTIDYVGIWNEKPYDADYIKTLKYHLESSGLGHVQIVAADAIGSNAWDIVEDIDNDAELQKAVSVVGAHYTGTYSTKAAKSSGKPLWASEDYSSEANDYGAGCLARLLNQNYVNGLMTGFIAWNLVTAYYDDLPYKRHSLMVAQQPWSGYYSVEGPVWAAAHTTQFTNIGWSYLKNSTGVGYLKKGGSYVSMVSPDKHDFTIIIETIDGMNEDFCLNIPMHPYRVLPQNVTFNLKGSLASLKSLNVWRSKIFPRSTKTTYFSNSGKIQVSNGILSLSLGVNEIITLTTTKHGKKGYYEKESKPAPFPIPYYDTFDKTKEYQEAFNFAQQVGAFEIYQTNDAHHGKILRQMVLEAPIHWCPFVQSTPINLVGNYNWSDISVSAQIRIPSMNSSSGAFLAARVDQGGCTTFLAKGVFFFLDSAKQVAELSLDLSRSKVEKSVNFVVDEDVWYDVELSIKGSMVTAVVNKEVVVKTSIKPTSLKGFAGLGSASYGLADFDNFGIKPL